MLDILFSVLRFLLQEIIFRAGFPDTNETNRGQTGHETGKALFQAALLRLKRLHFGASYVDGLLIQRLISDSSQPLRRLLMGMAGGNVPSLILR